MTNTQFKFRDYQTKILEHFKDKKVAGVFIKQRLGKAPIASGLMQLWNCRQIIYVLSKGTIPEISHSLQMAGLNVPIYDYRNINFISFFKENKTKSYCLLIEYASLHKIRENINNLKFDVLVIDESHAINNVSKRTKNCFWLNRRCHYFIDLTAEPWKNYPPEIYNHYYMWHFGKPPMTREVFNDTHFNQKKIHIGHGATITKIDTDNIFKSPQAINSFGKIIDQFCYSLNYEDVPEEYPNVKEKKEPKWIQPNPITVNYFLEAYNNLSGIMIGDQWINFYDTNSITLTMIDKLKKLLLWGDCYYGLDNPLTEELLKLVNRIKKPLLIFSCSEKYLSYLQKLIPNSVCLSGKNNNFDQDKADFINGKYRIALATIQKNKEGHSYAHVDDVVFLDFPWTSADLTQAKARVLPINNIQREQIKTYHYLTIDVPLMHSIYDLLRSKKKFYYTSELVQSVCDKNYNNLLDMQKNIDIMETYE